MDALTGPNPALTFYATGVDRFGQVTGWTQEAQLAESFDAATLERAREHYGDQPGAPTIEGETRAPGPPAGPAIPEQSRRAGRKARH